MVNIIPTVQQHVIIVTVSTDSAAGHLEIDAKTTTYIYIQFIVHLLTFLLVLQVAQRVKCHNIEEQSKKHVTDRHLYFKERRGASGWRLRKLEPASVKTSCVGELRSKPGTT